MNDRIDVDALVRDAIATTEVPLGDIGRARIGARLMDEVEASTAPRPQSPPSRWRLRAVMYAVVCMAIGWWLGRSGGETLELAVGDPPAAGVIPDVIPDDGNSAVTGQFELAPESDSNVALAESVSEPAPSAGNAKAVMRIVTAAAGERVAVRAGRAQLTLVGPARIEFDEAQPHAIRALEGTVLASSRGEDLTLTDASGRHRLAGPEIAIRVERGTVVASASTERSVQRVFRVELEAHRAAHGRGATSAAPSTPSTPATSSTSSTAPGMTAHSADDEGAGLAEAIDAGAPDQSVEETAASFYERSEAAMKSGRLKEAAALLEQLVRDNPSSPDAVLARYDLALLDHRAGRHDAAVRRLDEILANPSLRLRHRAASRLRCRVLASKAGTDASDC